MSCRLSKVGGVLALATGLLFGAAEAVKAGTFTINPGDTQSLDLLAGGANIFNSFTQTKGTGVFTDDYFFSLTSPPLGGVTTTTTLQLEPNGDPLGGTGFGLANFTATWFNPDGSTLASQTFTDGLG